MTGCTFPSKLLCDVEAGIRLNVVNDRRFGFDVNVMGTPASGGSESGPCSQAVDLVSVGSRRVSSLWISAGGREGVQGDSGSSSAGTFDLLGTMSGVHKVGCSQQLAAFPLQACAFGGMGALGWTRIGHARRGARESHGHHLP